MEGTQVFTEHYFDEALSLLCSLIKTPSLSREEDQAATLIASFLHKKNIDFSRYGNNLLSRNKYFDPDKPSILLNSHHDTVQPNAGYTKDPFDPVVENGKLFGLGSNDAGGCLVSLLMTFLHFYNRTNLPYNIIMAATAEEENSGKGGVESILHQIEPFEFGIVGEPTEMKMAVAEKGLMVIDAYAKGKSGHAARNQGVNAIYEAISDIGWFQTYEFPETSPYLGAVKMSVTMIDAGYQHNVIPDKCHFVVDIRSTDKYSNQDILDIAKQHVKAELVPRSIRLGSSYLPEDLKISRVADQLGIEKFGSPTTSDQAVMRFPTFKMGPGKSERSHTADEFLYLEELQQGIGGYIKLLEKLFE